MIHEISVFLFKHLVVAIIVQGTKYLVRHRKVDVGHVDYIIKALPLPKLSFFINLFEDIIIRTVAIDGGWFLNKEYFLFIQHMLNHLLIALDISHTHVVH
jgi:hypothetical protein